MLTLTYQNDVRKILALVLSTLKISPLPPEMTWLTSRKFHCAGGDTTILFTSQTLLGIEFSW